MKTLVHIGYHKTATTLLQKVFSQVPNAFLVPRETFWPRFLQPGSLEFDAQQARAWLEQQKSGMGPSQTHLVISEEELSGNVHTGGNGGYVSREAEDRLHAVMPDAEIVIFIRNQRDLIESCYRHYVREGGTFSIKNYLFDPYERSFRFPQFSFAHFDFDQLIGYYSQLFNRVHVFLYEDLSADSRHFIPSFLGDLGLDWSDSLAPIAGSRVNVGMSRASVFVARRLNRFHGADPINRRAFLDSPMIRRFSNRLCGKLDQMQWVRRLDRGHSFLTPEIVGYIDQRFADSNSLLAARRGLNLRENGYPMRPEDDQSHL